MSEQSKSGHVGTRRRAMCEEALGGFAIGLQHRPDGGGNPSAPGAVTHVCGEQRAGPDRLGENQPIARTKARLAQNAVAGDTSVDRKSHGQLGAFAGVAPDQRGAGSPEHRRGASQHVRQRILDLGFRTVRNRHQRQR